MGSLIAHRDYPMIGLDNNTAERAIRGPVVARKNVGGSRNEEAARLAATFWTVTATAEMARLNVLAYLTAYLYACGRNGGNLSQARELDRFLPWKASPEDRHAQAQPPPPDRRHPSRHDSGVTACSDSAAAVSMPAHRTSEYLRGGDE